MRAVVLAATGGCLSDGAPARTGDLDVQRDVATTADLGPDTAPPPKTWPRPCDAIYDQDRLPEFHLAFAAAEWDALTADCEAGTKKYRPVQFTYQGKTVAAKARLKGGWSWNCQKMQFVVSFNEDDVHARFRGLRKLSLDAPWYDHTHLHERLAFQIFAARGLPHSCANHAKLFINDSYYGLYSNIEHLDKEYLERNFEESDGNLYLAANELKTNEDIGDMRRAGDLKNATTIAQVAALVDLDETVAEWAVEAMIPAADNYWAGVEINFYIYDHPSRGFLWLPYDMDAIFGDTLYGDGSPVFPGVETADPIRWEHAWWGKEPLVQLVLADPTWCERFVDALRLARAVYVPEALAAQIDAWDAQIARAIADDPNKTWTEAQHAAAIEALKKFVRVRADYIDLWLFVGGHCPAVW